ADRTRNRGHTLGRDDAEARGDPGASQDRLLYGVGDGHELRLPVHKPGRGPGAADQGGPCRGHHGGARARAAVRREDQGALRRGPRLDGLRGRAAAPAAGRAPDGRRPRYKGRDRRRGQGHRALHAPRRGDGRLGPGHERHDHRRPPRRAGPPAPVRGLPKGVHRRGQGLEVRPSGREPLARRGQRPV
ncbi:MAG: DNA protection during starvation protein, partial [uncultured Rubrobacteraceae bacterium]